MCVLAPACRPIAPASARVMQVASVIPANGEGVFLDEDLIFYFTSDLDRASVTSASVRILASDGRTARGTYSVEGRTLKFAPAPVLARDLSDGGYSPGTRYQVELSGFPAVDGLRSVDGAPLESTYHWQFSTVAAGGQGLMFVDPAPEQTKPLALFPPPASAAESRYVIGKDDLVYLDSKKPIDPRSIDEDAFEVRLEKLPPARPGDSSAARDTDVVGTVVKCRARLVENEPEARRRNAPAGVLDPSVWDRESRAALIALTPARQLSEGTWKLVFRPAPDALRPLDFSAHVLVNPGTMPREIQVVERASDTQGELDLDFLDKAWSPVAVPGVDGTAYWNDGRVSVRYPAAAGDGSMGDVSLPAEADANDVQALDLTLEKGRTCALRSAPGLVVLRAQGRMVLSGNLRRATGRKLDEKKSSGDGTSGNDTHSSDGADYTEGDLALSKPGRASAAPTETLSAWLARMRAENRNCTVMIAGGDLVVDSQAEVELDTPLLLVAGGVVRIEGSVRVSSGSIYVLGEGGGLHVEPTRQSANLSLTMDTPTPNGTNPLRRELHWAVLSSPLPPRGSVAAWKRASMDGHHSADSGWSVRFVHEIGTMPAHVADLQPVDDPTALDPAGPIQVLIEVWMKPSPTFDPPFVDFVRLRWDQHMTGRPR